MAAKLLRTMSDENSDMPKHVGCMAGIFHLFGRGHFLSRRHVSRQSNTLPSGNTTSSSSTHIDNKQSSVILVPTESPKSIGKNPEKGRNIVRNSILYRDVRGISVRVSNKKESPTLTYIDSPRPSLPPPKSNKSKLYGFRESLPTDARFVHRKESPRFSYDGRESRPSTKIKELPRYSLDSKRPTSPPSEEHGSHRRQPSIVAKLMGLEDLEEMEVSEHDPISRSEEKKSAAPFRRLELAPWTRPERTTVYGQIEKRLAQLEFQKSGKDLRALKQILQAMQNNESKKESQKSLISGPTIKRKSTSPTFAMKPTKNTESGKNPTVSGVVPVPGLRKLDLGDKKRSEMKKQNQPSVDSRSPKQQKTKFSNRLDPAKRIDPSRQAKSKANLKVSGSNGLGSDNSSSCGESRNLTDQSNSISMQSDSMNSQEEMEVTSACRQERKKMASRRGEDDFIGKSHTPEQPSPVSVLDAIMYEDEPPSPVRMRKTAFKDSGSEIMHVRPMKPIQHGKEINPTIQDNGAKSKCIDEIQKRLVSDVVNELLIEKLSLNGSIPSVKQQQQLLKILSSEIDELPCKLDEEDNNCFRTMLEKDFGRRSADWKLGFSENAGIVFDIERMIFRDLICEVVNSEVTKFAGEYVRSRRQLFHN